MNKKSFFRFRWLIILLLFGLVFGEFLPDSTTPIAQAQGCAVSQIYRASISSGGAAEGNARSDPARISSDGRFIVFASVANNLVASDTNGQEDVFVHDQLNCTTTRISVTSGGAQATGGGSVNPNISNDGRYVVFQSTAINLVAGDTNGFEDVFLRDRLLLTTTRLSISTAGAQSNGASLNPIISGDGRIVAFESLGSNLVAGDANVFSDIFVRDITANQTSLVSISSGGGPANENSRAPSISGDGQVVAFSSYASNLITGDTNVSADAFVRDRLLNVTSRASVATGGGQVTGNFSDAGPALSADGRHVAFVSTSTDFVVGDLDVFNDIFVHDRVTLTTTRVSESPSGQDSTGDSDIPSISIDGRWITFESLADNLVLGDTGTRDIFLYDAEEDEITRITEEPGGDDANLDSFRASISTDGRYISFTSGASNLVPDDTNGHQDIFIYDASSGVAALFAPSNLIATPVSNTRINLVWADNSLNETNFQIERSNDGLSDWHHIATVAANQTTYSNLALFCQGRFYYRVRAYRVSDDIYSAYSSAANAVTFPCVADKLSLFQIATPQAAHALNTNSPAQPSDYNMYTLNTPPANLNGNWVMGDWNGDAIKTPGVYNNTGQFYYTNTNGPGATWSAIWIGLQGGRPVVAGRFHPHITTDCVGVVDSASFPPFGMAFALYYTCTLTPGTAPTLGLQWLSVVLPDSQGHSGAWQFCAGDFDGDREDSVAIRRGAFIAFTDRPPGPPEVDTNGNPLSYSLSAYNRAQYIGVPQPTPYGLFVCGDWNNDVTDDSFGIVYANLGMFYRREDLDWNSGLWTIQQIGTPLGTASIVAGSWR